MHWSVKGTPAGKRDPHRAKLRSPAEHVPALQWGQAGLSRLLFPPPILAPLGFPMAVAASPRSGGGARVVPHITQVRDGGN